MQINPAGDFYCSNYLKYEKFTRWHGEQTVEILQDSDF